MDFLRVNMDFGLNHDISISLSNGRLLQFDEAASCSPLELIFAQDIAILGILDQWPGDVDVKRPLVDQKAKRPGAASRICLFQPHSVKQVTEKG